MKPKTEKRLKARMRFFTPELYIRFNSDDDSEADLAEACWEKAIDDYRRHLRGLRKAMPAAVKSLTERCLHDFEVLSFHQQLETLIPARGKKKESSSPGSGVAVLCLRHSDEIQMLLYVLTNPVKHQVAPRNWPFSKERKHCLYDEIDAADKPAGSFLHRILFSDGSMLEIPFSLVFVDQFPLPANGSRPRPRKRAS